MQTAFRLIALISVFAATSLSQSPDRFYGKIVGVQPDYFHMYQRVFSLEKPHKYKFVPALEPKTSIAAGKLTDGRGSGEIEALLVEIVGGSPFIAVDINADSTIGTDERFTFRPTEGQGYLSANLRLPIKHPLLPSFPVFIRYYRGFKHPQLKASDRLLDQSVWAHAIGDVRIEGKTVRFQYPFDPERPTISTTEGLFGIDVDGDGIIRNEQFSLETSYAADSEIVMRYGDVFLSTASIDLAKNEIIVRRRPKAEYLREDLEVGKPMADFSFVDFSGKKRTLSEFRGKYLLIEWWGVWCVDCVRDMPFTVEAYERLRSRGFEFLGMNWDDKLEDALGFLTKSKATWPQARKNSIKQLTEVSYRVQEYPSSVLLDPQGKVVSLDQKALQGPNLLPTLERLIPR